MRRECKEKLERVSHGGNRYVHSIGLYNARVQAIASEPSFYVKALSLLYLSVTDPYIVSRQ